MFDLGADLEGSECADVGFDVGDEWVGAAGEAGGANVVGFLRRGVGFGAGEGEREGAAEAGDHGCSVFGCVVGGNAGLMAES